jgi:hypothetical protein
MCEIMMVIQKLKWRFQEVRDEWKNICREQSQCQKAAMWVANSMPTLLEVTSCHKISQMLGTEL